MKNDLDFSQNFYTRQFLLGPLNVVANTNWDELTGWKLIAKEVTFASLISVIIGDAI